MKQKKWKAITSIVLLVALFVVGFIAIAAEYGTSDDPLVSLSYINNVLAPKIEEKVDEIIAEKTASLGDELEAKVNSVSAEIDDKISSYTAKSADEIVTDSFIAKVSESVAAKVGNTGTAAAPSTFAVVKLNAGQTITAKVGCEILLRIGTMSCTSTNSVGLIDVSTGTVLAGGSALTANHLYLCTIDGRTIKATANATILIRGPYSLS